MSLFLAGRPLWKADFFGFYCNLILFYLLLFSYFCFLFYFYFCYFIYFILFYFIFYLFIYFFVLIIIIIIFLAFVDTRNLVLFKL